MGLGADASSSSRWELTDTYSPAPIDNAPASRQQVLAGMLKALGVSTGKRVPFMAELPTLMEEGVPNFDVASWYGVAAPASTPRPIIERLGREIVDALHDPAIIQKTRDFGAEPMPLLPRDYDAFMAAEVTDGETLCAEAEAVFIVVDRSAFVDPEGEPSP